MKKLLIGTAITLTLLVGISAASTDGHLSENLITGSFTAADNPSAEDEVYIESIKWDLGNGKTVEGPIAKSDYPPGEYNVTVTVEKSNGEVEVYKKLLKVKQ